MLETELESGLLRLFEAYMETLAVVSQCLVIPNIVY